MTLYRIHCSSCDEVYEWRTVPDGYTNGPSIDATLGKCVFCKIEEERDVRPPE